MARTTIANSRAELFGLVAATTTGNESAPVASLTKVTRVFKYEPTSLAKPVSITIGLGDITPLEWRILLRIYVSADSTVEQAQADLDTTIDQVDALMTDGWGPSNFAFSVEEQADSGQRWLVATSTFDVLRAY